MFFTSVSIDMNDSPKRDPMKNTTPSYNRLLSLDVFRGLTIVLMILVNSPGTMTPYPILDHALWHGCTLADLVFPSFLFIVGLTSVISLNRQLGVAGVAKQDLYYGIIKRSILLIAFGLFLNVYPTHIDIHHLRVYGVLQRIGLCYCICALIYLNTEPKTQILLFLGILWGYWLLMTQIPVPGFGANHLSESGSWVSYLDMRMFSANHLYGKTYDPEGFLTTIPSVATTLIGMIAATLLLAQGPRSHKFYWLFAAGSVFLLLGWLWNYSFPINKNLWTSSFVLWSGGCSLLAFALCYLVIDVFGYTAWALPFKIFGMNALFAFVFHVVLIKTQFLFYVPLPQGGRGPLRSLVSQYLFGGCSAQNASLFYSLVFIGFNFIVVSILYWRKIFIRI